MAGGLRPHFPATRADQAAAAIVAAELALWQLADDSQRSATLTEVFERAGIAPPEALLASYFQAWDPHTFTDADAGPLLRELRDRGIRVGVLSNTMWPRSAHERVFRRDGVLDLIDAAVYSSEIPWTKPHPEAFLVAIVAVGVDDPAALRVRGRPALRRRARRQAGGHAGRADPHSEVPPFDEVTPDAVITRLADLRGPTWTPGPPRSPSRRGRGNAMAVP